MKANSGSPFNIHSTYGFIEIREFRIDRDAPSMIDLHFKIYYKEQNIDKKKTNS